MKTRQGSSSDKIMKEDYFSYEQVDSYSDNPQSSLCQPENDCPIREMTQKMENHANVPAFSRGQDSAESASMTATFQLTELSSQCTTPSPVTSTEDHHAPMEKNEEDELEIPSVAIIVQTFEAAIFREQTKADFLAKCLGGSRIKENITHTFINNEPGNVSSFARMRQPVETSASVPLFSQNDFTPTRTLTSQEAQIALQPYDHKQTGRARSMSKTESIQSSAKESTWSSRTESKKRLPGNGRRKKRMKLQHEEKMRNLLTEFLHTSLRYKSLPCYSPEWTLSKFEMKLIIDELEYLYAESMDKTKEGVPA